MAVHLSGDLNQLLADKGLSQRVVAQRMGIAQQHLSRMITGKRVFHLRHARAFSMATAIPLATVLEAIEPKTEDER